MPHLKVTKFFMRIRKKNIKIRLIILCIFVGIISCYWILNETLRPLSEKECKILHMQIVNQINKANYCNNNGDCVIIKSDILGCDFGCWEVVNKNEVSTIERMIKNYYQRGCGLGYCLYKCIIPVTAKCENSTCIPKFFK